MICSFCDKGEGFHRVSLGLGIEAVICNDCFIVFKRVFGKHGAKWNIRYN